MGRILIVDDEKDLVQLIGDLLSFAEPMPDTEYVDRTFVDALGSAG